MTALAGSFASGRAAGLTQAITDTRAHICVRIERTLLTLRWPRDKPVDDSKAPAAMVRSSPMRTLWSVVAVVALVTTSAFADDDDLVPLAKPGKPAPKAPSKTPVKVAPKAPGKTPVKPSGDDDLVPITRAPGKLQLKISKAALASVTLSVDGADLGPLTETTVPVDAGEHLIVIKRPGFANLAKRVTIFSDKVTDLPVTMQAVAAVLSIKTDSGPAEVFVNGKYLKSAPFTGVEVTPGTIELSVRKQGFKDATQTLKVVAGIEYPMTISLIAVEAVKAPPVDAPVATNVTPNGNEPPPGVVGEPVPEVKPITSQWYFWAGIGAVVAAAAVGTVVGVNAYNNQPPVKLTRDRACKELKDCICFNCSAALAMPLP